MSTLTSPASSCAPQVPSTVTLLHASTTGEARMEPDWATLLEVAQREARRLVGDTQSADDAAAVVLKRIWSRLSRIEAEDLEPYVRRSVLNEVRDQWRRAHTPNGRAREVEFPDDEAVRAKRMGSARRWMASSPSAKFVRRERDERVAQMVAEMLAGLSDRNRLLLRLAADETLTYEDIAAEMGYASADTVKTTVSRLRKALRDKFGPEYEELLREW